MIDYEDIIIAVQELRDEINLAFQQMDQELAEQQSVDSYNTQGE